MDLYDVARDVTDEVLGAGTYAKVNEGTPDPNVAAAVRRGGEAAGRKAGEEDRNRRNWTITKFGRHPDGYFQAHVTIDGRRYYVHSRHGSWMAPGKVRGREVMKELEALGMEIEVKIALQEKARSWRRRNAPMAIPQMFEEEELAE